MSITFILILIAIFVIATIIAKQYGDQIYGLIPRIPTNKIKEVSDVLPNQVSESINLQQEI